MKTLTSISTAIIFSTLSAGTAKAAMPISFPEVNLVNNVPVTVPLVPGGVYNKWHVRNGRNTKIGAFVLTVSHNFTINRPDGVNIPVDVTNTPALIIFGFPPIHPNQSVDLFDFFAPNKTLTIDMKPDINATLTYDDAVFVPGPLPILGAVVGFRYSRRLRRKLNSTCQSK